MIWVETKRYRKRGKAGVAGIVAAVILFAMLFTVGTGYFMFVNSSNTLYNSAVSARNSALQSQTSESVQLTTIAVSDSACSGGQCIGLYVNNTGGVGVNITSIYILYTGKTHSICMGVGLPKGCLPALISSPPPVTSFPGCQFPAYVNVGKGTRGIPTKSGSGCTSATTGSVIDTEEPANSTVATVRVITQRGNIFAATYPPTAETLAAQALSSGAIGDLYMSFSSYSYYSVTTGGSCPTGSSCLNLQQQMGAAFTIPYNFGPSIGFSVSVTDLNPNQLNITLDQYSLINHVIESGSGAVKYYVWYIVGTHTSGGQIVINSTFTHVFLPYDKPVTLYFASSSPVTASGFSAQGLSQVKQGSTAPIFIVSHGWKGMPFKSQVETNANYGQNSPYVTTLYY